jgi:hypothetical protein
MNDSKQRHTDDTSPTPLKHSKKEVKQCQWVQTSYYDSSSRKVYSDLKNAYSAENKKTRFV